MTRKEKVAEMMPSAINKATAGGVNGCPHYYPFLNIAEERRKCLIDKPSCSGTELFENVKNAGIQNGKNQHGLNDSRTFLISL